MWVKKKGVTMQHILHVPIVDKYSIQLEDDNVRVGASSMQGWRSSMEDAHTIALELPVIDQRDCEGLLVTICDGHAGHKTAHTVAKSIKEWICSTEEFSEGEYRSAMIEGYARGDVALRKGAEPDDVSGATAVTLMMVGRRLYCANAGDSRAILCRDGKAWPLSEDHKPTLPVERERIVRAGSFVLNGRVNGILALSRAFGDFTFKQNDQVPFSQQAVTVMPEVSVTDLQPNDDFVVLACDGLWDCMTSDQVVNYVRLELGDHGDCALCCEKLMDRCVSQDGLGIGTDNMTIVIVQLKSQFIQKLMLPASQSVFET